MALPNFKYLNIERNVETICFCFKKENKEIFGLYECFIGYDTMKDGLLNFKNEILDNIEEMTEIFQSGYLKIINETHIGDELKSKKATFVENIKIDKKPNFSYAEYANGYNNSEVSFRCKCDITIKVDNEILIYDRKIKLNKI